MSAPPLRPLSAAPSLPARGLLGHLPALRRDLLSVFAAAQRSGGDLVRLRVLYRRLLLLRQVLGQGLLTSEGDLWRQRRRTANPAFRPKEVAGFARTMGQAAAGLAERWAAAGEVDAAEAMNQLTLRIAGECFFSQDISGASSEIGAALTAVLDEFARVVAVPIPGWERLPTPGNRRYHLAKRALDRAAREIVAARRASSEQRGDLLGLLLAARDPETGEGLSDEALRDEVLTMLMAGHETTANALAWTLHLLSQHPEAAARVAAEVDAVVGGGLPTPEQARALAYTSRVFQESMRLFPPAWIIPRRAVADDCVDGYPEGFDPDRFARPPAHPYAFVPFGAGKRKRIGSHFADLESLVVLAVLAQRLRLAAAPGRDVRPAASVTLRPKGALRLRAQAR